MVGPGAGELLGQVGPGAGELLGQVGPGAGELLGQVGVKKDPSSAELGPLVYVIFMPPPPGRQNIW